MIRDDYKGHMIGDDYKGHMIRDDYFQLFIWFQLFSSEEKIPQVAGRGQNRSKIDFLKEGVYRFSYFHWFSNQTKNKYHDSSNLW
jgi:hypothetical protein